MSNQIEFWLSAEKYELVRNTINSEWIRLGIVVAGIAVLYESYVAARSWNCSLRWMCRMNMWNVRLRVCVCLCFCETTSKMSDDLKLLFAAALFFIALDIDCTASMSIASTFAVAFNIFIECFFRWRRCGVDLNLWQCEVGTESIADTISDRFVHILNSIRRFPARITSHIHVNWNKTFFDMSLTVHGETVAFLLIFIGSVVTESRRADTECELFAWNGAVHEYFIVNFSRVSSCCGTCYAFEMRLADVSRPCCYESTHECECQSRWSYSFIDLTLTNSSHACRGNITEKVRENWTHQMHAHQRKGTNRVSWPKRTKLLWMFYGNWCVIYPKDPSPQKPKIWPFT